MGVLIAILCASGALAVHALLAARLRAFAARRTGELERGWAPLGASYPRPVRAPAALPPRRQPRARLLARAREDLGLSRARVAQELSVDEATVSRWERGERLPGPRQLISLAYLLATPVPVLLFGEGSHGEPAPEAETLGRRLAGFVRAARPALGFGLRGVRLASPRAALVVAMLTLGSGSALAVTTTPVGDVVLPKLGLKEPSPKSADRDSGRSCKKAGGCARRDGGGEPSGAFSTAPATAGAPAAGAGSTRAQGGGKRGASKHKGRSKRRKRTKHAPGGAGKAWRPRPGAPAAAPPVVAPPASPGEGGSREPDGNGGRGDGKPGHGHGQGGGNDDDGDDERPHGNKPGSGNGGKPGHGRRPGRGEGRKPDGDEGKPGRDRGRGRGRGRRRRERGQGRRRGRGHGDSGQQKPSGRGKRRRRGRAGAGQSGSGSKAEPRERDRDGNDQD